MGELLGALTAERADPLAGVDLRATDDSRRQGVEVHQAHAQVQRGVLEPDTVWPTRGVAGANDAPGQRCEDRVATPIVRGARNDQVPGEVEGAVALDVVGATDVAGQRRAVVVEEAKADLARREARAERRDQRRAGLAGDAKAGADTG